MIDNYGAWIFDNMHANLVKKSKPLCEEEFQKFGINLEWFDFLMILVIDDYMCVAWWIEEVVGWLLLFKLIWECF